MAKKINFKSKKTWKNIGLGCLAGVLGIGAVMGVGALLNREEDLTKTINPTYAVGGLTEQGQYLETEGSIYTKEAFECQGIDVSLAFDNNVSYRIFFYDEDNDFISATEKQTNNYDETTTPIIAKYARIVITPNDDDEIKWHEKNGYAKQLTIEVNKEQKDISYSSNLMVVKGWGSYGSDGTWTESAETNKQYGFLFSEDLEISSYDKLLVQMPKAIFENANTKVLLRGETNQSIDFSLVETTINNEIVSFEVENIGAFNTLRIYTNYDVDYDLFASVCVYGVK